MPYGAAINLAHRDETGKGSGDEGFVGPINVIKRELFFENWNAVVLAEADQVAAGNARNAVLPGRRPDFAAPHNEEVGGVAGGDKAQRIEHERLVGAGVHGLHASSDAIEF